MTYYDKIDVSDGVDDNKASKLKEFYLSLLILFK